jgi:hypothetical protein
MPAGYVTVSKVLVLLAVIMFVLAAFGVSVGSVSLVPLGLAVWAAASLVP